MYYNFYVDHLYVQCYAGIHVFLQPQSPSDSEEDEGNEFELDSITPTPKWLKFNRKSADYEGIEDPIQSNNYVPTHDSLPLE